MPVRVVTPPSLEPISVEEAKEHLRIDGFDEDSYIDSLIVTAREWAEKCQRRALITQTLRYSCDAFPTGREIELPRPSLQSVTSIAYKDKDGNVHTLDPATYAVDTESIVGRVVLMPGASWPTFEAYPVNAVSITYEAGYGDAPSDVPQRTKQAMFLLVGYWYANREAAQTGALSRQVAFSVESLLAFDRVNG